MLDLPTMSPDLNLAALEERLDTGRAVIVKRESIYGI